MEDQILNQILDELKELKQGQSKLEAGQADLREYVKDLLAGQNKNEKDILRLEGYIKDIKISLLDVKHKQEVALVKLDAVFDHVIDLTESHTEVKQRLLQLETV